MSRVNSKFGEELDTLFDGASRGGGQGRVHDWNTLFDGRSHPVVPDRGKFMREYLRQNETDPEGLSDEEVADAFTELSGLKAEDVGELHGSSTKSFRGMAWQTAKRRGLQVRLRVHPKLGCLVIKSYEGEAPAAGDGESGEGDADVVDEGGEHSEGGETHAEGTTGGKKKRRK